MARKARRKDRFRTQAPKEATVVIAAILWLLGFADVVLNAYTLPSSLGVWALVIAGLLLIVGSLVDEI